MCNFCVQFFIFCKNLISLFIVENFNTKIIFNPSIVLLFFDAHVLHLRVKKRLHRI